VVSISHTAALEALLPDRRVAAHPEHQLKQREEESREAQALRHRKRAARRLAVAQLATVIPNLRPLGFWSGFLGGCNGGFPSRARAQAR
jgi:hypothetical protein